MSKRYPGGLITKTPVVPTTTSAPGIWTLDQALGYIKAGTWPGNNLVTVTLSGSGTWVAPFGVNSVTATIVGSGGYGSFWTNNRNSLSPNFQWTSATSPTQASANAAIDAWLSAWIGTINSGAPAERTLTGPYDTNYTLDNGDTVTVTEGLRFYDSTPYVARGTSATSRTSNATLNTAAKLAYAYIDGPEFQENGSAGVSSSFAGYSAAGGSVGSASSGYTPNITTGSTLIQTVSVTPGSGYSYLVGEVYTPFYGSIFGSITLSYLQ